MIKYRLICKNCEISFDSWFSSSLEYEKLKNKRFLTCHYCNSKNIIIEAYSPLVHAKRMDESRLVSISEELGKTPAQILIRWAIQRGMVVLPKSVNEGRIIENFAVLIAIR